MTRPQDPLDPLDVAVEAYRARFGAASLPHLWLVDTRVAARVLALAVKRGRPIRQSYVIARLSGGWRRDPGPDVVQ